MIQICVSGTEQLWFFSASYTLTEGYEGVRTEGSLNDKANQADRSYYFLFTFVKLIRPRDSCHIAVVDLPSIIDTLLSSVQRE